MKQSKLDQWVKNNVTLTMLIMVVVSFSFGYLVF